MYFFLFSTPSQPISEHKITVHAHKIHSDFCGFFLKDFFYFIFPPCAVAALMMLPGGTSG
jgi:hypothetical protein